MTVLMVAGLDSFILNLLKHTKMASKTVLCYRMMIFLGMCHFQPMSLAGLLLGKTLSNWRVLRLYDKIFYWNEDIWCLSPDNWYRSFLSVFSPCNLTKTEVVWSFFKLFYPHHYSAMTCFPDEITYLLVLVFLYRNRFITVFQSLQINITAQKCYKGFHAYILKPDFKLFCTDYTQRSSPRAAAIPKLNINILNSIFFYFTSICAQNYIMYKQTKHHVTDQYLNNTWETQKFI